MTQTGNERTEEFINQLMANHQRIYAFILTLVPNTEDADDIMQETSTVMWRKYSEFKTGGNFVSWGISIAHKKIYENRRKKASHRLVFNDHLIDIMSAESKENTSRMKN